MLILNNDTMIGPVLRSSSVSSMLILIYCLIALAYLNKRCHDISKLAYSIIASAE